MLFHIDNLVQGYGYSIANTLELPTTVLYKSQQYCIV